MMMKMVKKNNNRNNPRWYRQYALFIWGIYETFKEKINKGILAHVDDLLLYANTIEELFKLLDIQNLVKQIETLSNKISELQ